MEPTTHSSWIDYWPSGKLRARSRKPKRQESTLRLSGARPAPDHRPPRRPQELTAGDRRRVKTGLGHLYTSKGSKTCRFSISRVPRLEFESYRRIRREVSSMSMASRLR